MKKILIIFILFSFLSPFENGNVFAQEVFNYYKLIEQKLSEDRKYLNIYDIPVELNKIDIAALQKVPRLSNKGAPYSFRNESGYTYIFEFLDETLETDSITLLRVYLEVDNSVQGEGEGLFDQISGGPNYDTTIVLDFRDLHELYFSDRAKYDYLLKILYRALDEQQPNAVLGIAIDEKLMKSKGISGKNNQDFLNYNWVNSEHYFPRPLLKKKVRRGRNRKAVNFPYHLEASFSHVTFYDSKHFNYGFSNISGEINTESKVLNLLPWQAMTMSLGIRTFISFSDVVQNLYDDFLINARVLARFRINTSSFAANLPFVYTEKPGLNVVSGIIMDVSTTRIYGLPFFNFYYATGFSDYGNPYVTFGRSDSSRAYFNTSAWEASMSFYWNTSEKLNMRFRMDIGLGGFDANKVVYYKGRQTVYGYYRIHPMINFYFTFVPNKNELFGMKARFFDSVMRGKFWIKFLELNKIHTFRFEVEYLSAPFFRRAREWETSSGASVQFVYRLGF